MHITALSCLHLAVTVSLILFCAIGCHAQCTITHNWSPVLPETNYDRNTSSVNDPAGRPLGYAQAVIEYSDNENPIDPCIHVTGATDRRIEIMAESDPPGSVMCVKDQSNQNPICSTLIYDCRQAIADTVAFEFYCDADSCDESSVTLWYRFVISEDPAVLDPELWCAGRDTGEYPTSLNNVLPPDTDLSPQDPNAGFGGAMGIVASTTTVVIASLFGLLFVIH
ncbi:uncharacterized protein LOC578221 [Strongylocentrotus purpuratus]|uniref:Uncharacterized protein n=1 Tax=Strongylocentrotus purpuratus TaxID=7668 RepID=A0A7M7RGU5_STRPU|nr:uncharacterized protein LOC578221 [Strongylocentrotus purpuratus]|eukprot:XP_799988.1 PREDICTED: uncharacterized protein LOC578221 [Strongylocentrotus purpuratus]